MTSMGLNLKRSFINKNALMNNGIGRYVPQLARITLKFCKSHGSSQGVRSYIEPHIVDFAQNNPATVVYLKPRRHRAPTLVAEYLNGERYTHSLHNYGVDEVIGYLEMYRGHSGVVYSEQYKYSYTDHPSIQGFWNASTNREPSETLIKYPSNKQPLDIEESATQILQDIFKSQLSAGGGDAFTLGEDARLEHRKQGE